MNSCIESVHLSKWYEDKEILRDISFSIREKEIFGIIGPSGSGKSTLLRLIDLIETPTQGTLTILGEETTGTDARFHLRRRMAMLSQKPVIFNRSVYDNIAIGMQYRGASRSDIDTRVLEALGAIGLSGYASRAARTLSGGEAQRVALARAIVTDPEILFLDEPTANLDPVSTETIEEIIVRLNHRREMTIVLSTHDMLQGQRLSDRMSVIMEGEMLQVGTPREIFHAPTSTKIARFVGVENVLDGIITGNRGGEVSIDAGGTEIHAISSLPEGQKVKILFRAEDVTLDLAPRERTSARNHVHGTIAAIVPHGPYVYITCTCGIDIRTLVTPTSVDELDLSYGKEVWVSFKATAVHVMADGEENI